MHEWPSIVLLAAQAILTIGAVEQLRRRVFVALHAFPQPALIIDVWAPMTLVLPMMFFVGRIEDSVHGVGWIVIGGPVMCAGMGLGAACLAANGSADRALHVLSISPRTLVIWSGAGLVLLLLGAAHDLTMWVGQCTFAAAALLLWINTPDDPLNNRMLAPSQISVGVAMTIALLCALGQGIAAFFIEPKWAGVSGGLMMGGVAIGVACAARVAGPLAALRMGGWAAAYGVALGLGLMAVLFMLRVLRQVWPVPGHGGRGMPTRRVAFGFGEYWIEAVALLAFSGAAVVLWRGHHAVRRLAGISLVVASAALAAWRLSRI